MFASEACFINFLFFKLLINFNISWSLDALPSIIIKSAPLYSILENLTLLGTAEAIWANTLKFKTLFELIELLNSSDFEIIFFSFKNLFLSVCFN